MFALVPVILIAVLKPPFDTCPEPKQADKFDGLAWRGIGPALMSGRISDVVIHPTRTSTWYVAVGSGGIFKTENAGTTWQPIFDDQGAYSIGCLTLDPQNHETVWVGTGENVGGRHVGFGDGVYRSQDGGKSWKNMGLKRSEHIGMIRVDPRDSNRIYVAAQGPLWSAGGDRGLFMSQDGGQTWEKILGQGEYVGCNEVHLDPRNPDVIYAAMHQRYRNVAVLMDGGPGSGIFKSTDAGSTWVQLKSGLPEGSLGKIGMAISPMQPDVVYATIEVGARKGGFFRSQNGGHSWEKRNDYLSGGTGPHYYQEIFASPYQFDRVYQMDVWMHVTHDGGKTFTKLGEKNKHSDNHALAFSSVNPDYLLSGCDGGLYESFDQGATWKFFANLPITQFYKVAVDYDLPFYNLYGGTQDNNTQGGPSQTDNISGIRNSDWFVTLFGDGHQPAVDPENPDIVYSEWQQGNLVRYDRKNGEITYIRPQPAPDEPAERWNWDAPILISPHNSARLYYASHRLWCSEDRGDSWRVLSTDLSRGEERLQQPVMGQTWGFEANWDLYAMSNYGSITSLAESPLLEGLLYAGTDDGLIQVSEDTGSNWKKIDVKNIPGVPANAFVNDIKADLHDTNRVYVALDNHKNGDFRPMLAVSDDRGKKWKSMVGDLPDNHLVWRIVQDHVDPKLIFVGTEFGVFFTRSDGVNWNELKGSMPQIPVRDITIQKNEDDLVAATFGRGFFILDNIAPLRQIDQKVLDQEAVLFSVPKAWWYVPQRPLAMAPQAYQGSAFFVAPNPAFGAVITYHLAKGFVSARDQRIEAEKKDGKGKVPSWEVLKLEEQEDAPAVLLQIRDDQGQLVRVLEGPAKAGFHRVAWDLRYPKLDAWKPTSDEDYFLGDQGWLAAPGQYEVQLFKRMNGQTVALSEPQTFEVKPLPGYEHHLPADSPIEVAAFYRKIESLQRSSTALRARVEETRLQLTAMKDVIMRSTADPALRQHVLAIEKEIYEIEERVAGDRIKNRIGEPVATSLSDRVFALSLGNLFSTKGPTASHMQLYEFAKQGISDVTSQLNHVNDVLIQKLASDMDAAGVPWSPGRKVVMP